MTSIASPVLSLFLMFKALDAVTARVGCDASERGCQVCFRWINQLVERLACLRSIAE